MNSPSAPGLFEGTAWYYSRFRFGYPPPLFDFLAAKFTLSSATRVLDLGCGTGQLSVPLAARGVPVIAIDPDAEMLAEGIRSEERNGVIGVAWMRGSDETLQKLHLPPVHLCVMGASFHWTKRDALLAYLDGVVTGGVSVIDGGRAVWSDRDWSSVTKEVIADFLGPERRAGGGVYAHPTDRHETVLARSPFRNIEKATFKYEKRVSVDEIVGLQLSMSFASPAQLGSRLEEFKRVLSHRLLELNPSGTFLGEISAEVLAATR